MNNNYIEQFKGVEAGPLVQFVKYGISGGLATFVHIVIFHFNKIYINIKCLILTLLTDLTQF